MLETEEIDAVFHALMREFSTRGIETDLLKPQFRAGVESTHNWLQANKTAFNQYLPANVRNDMNMASKMLMFFRVIEAISKKEFEEL